MFEAHQPTTELSQTKSPYREFSPTDHNINIIDEIIYNQAHGCFVRAWSSIGKQKNQQGHVSQTLFLYIEYKNQYNNACYLCKELAQQQFLDNTFLIKLAESVLLADISASKTDIWITQMQK